MTKYVMIVLLVLVLVVPVAAQDENADETHPLYEMLALIPVTPDVLEGMLGYADFRATETARNIETPESWATLMNGDDSLWLDAVNRSLVTIPPVIGQVYVEGVENWQQMIGFDYMDIHQSVHAGALEEHITLLKGNFDPQQMDTALTALDFEKAEATEAVTLWCWTEGCDEGHYIDFAARNISNPFGGELGMHQPLAHLAPNMIVNSPDEPAIRRVLDLYQGNTENILTIPAYKAIADFVIREDALLRQLLFVRGSMVSSGNPVLFLSGDAATVEMMRERFAQFGRLPGYELLAFVDMAYPETGTEQAQVIVVYEDADTAQAALEELTVRLPMVPSTIEPGSSFMDLLDMSDSTQLPLEITNDEANGKSLLIIRFEAQIPSNELDEGGIFYTESARMFYLLLQQLYAGDLTWLQETVLLPE